MAMSNWQRLLAYVMKFGNLSQQQAEQCPADHTQAPDQAAIRLNSAVFQQASHQARVFIPLSADPVFARQS